MRIETVIHPDHVCIVISNTACLEKRIWEFRNSWGWDSISFHLKKESEEKTRIIKRMPRDWTRNMPSFFVLKQGESREIQLNINDGWWDKGENLSNLKDVPVLVRACLKIGPSPEAEKYGVFVGTVLSDWVVSMPPHGWLFERDREEEKGGQSRKRKRK